MSTDRAAIQSEPRTTKPSEDAQHCAVFDVCRTVPRNTEPLAPLAGPPEWSGGECKAQSAVPPGAVETGQRSSTNVFVDAVATAFFDHYPLELSPDGVWLLVMQGLAAHVKNNAEELRRRFVQHEGQKEIEVVDASLRWASPPAAWAAQVPKYEQEILQRIAPERAATLCPRFSTTTPDTRIASVVCLMDMMQHYFAYRLRGGCGIPAIHLLGTPEDWRAVRGHAADALDGLGCAWWRDELLPVLDQFVAAAQGRVDEAFWACVVTYPEGSGSEVPFTGWINALCPYIRGEGSLEKAPLPPRDASEPRFAVVVRSLDGRTLPLNGVAGTHTFMDVMRAVGVSGRIIVNRKERKVGATLASNNVQDGDVFHLLPDAVECDIPNPAITAWRDRGVAGIPPSKYLSGRSKAPVTYREHVGSTDTTRDLSFEAGFTCVAQHPQTLAVRAAIGWAITWTA